MRLITWNCQGAFRNKASVILKHKPDILVIQECECAENEVGTFRKWVRYSDHSPLFVELDSKMVSRPLGTPTS